MPGDQGTVPVTVVVPTIGRAELLTSCLHSIQSCRPAAAEVLVVDQSGNGDVARLVAGADARHVRCPGRGTGTATNLGLREAGHETVLVTHDDCTVSDGWIGEAAVLAAAHPNVLFTGRVLPVGDVDAVPSTIDDPTPRDYTGELHAGALYPNNMVLPRGMALALGGFDDRVGQAEDNDFSYRWLRAGHGLRYEPRLVVSHHDWRSPAELEQLYRRYFRGQGLFYAKHLRAGDRWVLRFLLSDLYRGARGSAAATISRRPKWSDPRPRIWKGLLPGLAAGWRRFG